ncbi:MAG: hypothetical protein JWN34_1688 [Bryobacterales bacterium]|nr:hypothetical protein [Bryobacterales bacterium]
MGEASLNHHGSSERVTGEDDPPGTLTKQEVDSGEEIVDAERGDGMGDEAFGPASVAPASGTTEASASTEGPNDGCAGRLTELFASDVTGFGRDGDRLLGGALAVPLAYCARL